MAAYFIADLHLSEDCPLLVHAFEKFVASLKDGDELYILGDLFNYFVGIDEQDKAQQAVKEALSKAKALGIPSYFVRGNRDFLISKRDAAKLNMLVLEDKVLLEKGSSLIMASHGDAFCTNDVAYQKYAKTVSNPAYQFIFRCLPMSIRRNIGKRIRDKSKQMNYQRRDPSIYGIVTSAVAEAFTTALHHRLKSPQDPQAQDQQHMKKVVVHGHIHEFSQYDHEVDAYDTRYVLGAWGKHFSYLKCESDGIFSFVEHPIGD